MAAYTLEIMIALEDGVLPTPDWWADRYRRGHVRAGGMPAEVADPARANVKPVTDPETGDRFARVRMPLPAGTNLGRARELAHMLTSVLAGEGWTLRNHGKRVETLPGESPGQPAGTLGGTGFSEARVCSDRCMDCVLSGDSRIGCCTEGAAFSLADIGAALLGGDDQLVAHCLALPGELDGVKWHPYLSAGRCTYHDRSCGCTLPPARMPLQCRTFLCMPEKLLPPALLADYEAYVESLEEAEDFIDEHMRREGGVDFASPPDALMAAAAKAFAAWAAVKPGQDPGHTPG
ncbi:MAG TPA: hypothetical protein VGK74_13770 [Symbiobacteriaceae bacterium]